MPHRKKLNSYRVKTALQLARMTPAVVRKNFTLILERNVRELNGEACIFLEEAPPTKQHIVCCRSFGERIRTYESLRQDICQYAEGAAENLHEKIQFCRHISFPQDLFFRHQLSVIWHRGQRKATLAYLRGILSLPTQKPWTASGSMASDMQRQE